MFDYSCSRRSFLGLAGGVAAFAGLGLAGCGSQSATQGSAAGSAAASSSLSGTINCSGATSFQPLVEAAADNFMNENPDVSVAISAGGSGQGLSDIAEGKAQIGRSDVFAESKLDADQCKGLVDNQVCVVGMGPIVSTDVDIDDITTEQLKGIFTGEITDWSEVGASAGKIAVINRESGSGTRATFEAAVLQGAEVPASFTPAQELDASGQVVEAVASTPLSISYVAFNYFETNDGIKALSVDGVDPTQENVESGDFNIWAYEHMYTREDADEVTKAFMDYMMSDDVQGSLVTEQGFIPMTNMKVKKDVDGNVTAA